MRALFLLLCMFCMLTITGHVSAHPLDEVGNITLYDQKQILEVGRQTIRLQVTMTFYALEKVKVWESIDRNKDRIISKQESDNWIRLGNTSSWIVMNNKKEYFTPQSLVIRDYYDFFSPSPSAITIHYVLNKPVDINHDIVYAYRGKDKKLQEIHTTVTGSDGLMVSHIQKIPPDQLSIRIKPGEGESQVLGVTYSNKLGSFLSRYVKPGTIPFSLTLWALVIAYSLGALHALTPGHGKAIAAGYLIGERGTVFHALNLGLIITITHTASVFVLGLASLLLTQYIVPVTIIRILNTVSGVLICVLGIYLIIVRIRALRSNHGHHHDHDHDHEHGHDHHHHVPVRWRNLITLGISGGIVPCVDALAIVVVAVSLQKVVFGLVLLVAFSAGLATVLVGAGMMVVFAKSSIHKRFHSIHSFERYIGVVSAVIVTILGVLILTKR